MKSKNIFISLTIVYLLCIACTTQTPMQVWLYARSCVSCCIFSPATQARN